MHWYEWKNWRFVTIGIAIAGLITLLASFFLWNYPEYDDAIAVLEDQYSFSDLYIEEAWYMDNGAFRYLVVRFHQNGLEDFPKMYFQELQSDNWMIVQPNTAYGGIEWYEILNDPQLANPAIPTWMIKSQINPVLLIGIGVLFIGILGIAFTTFKYKIAYSLRPKKATDQPTELFDNAK